MRHEGEVRWRETRAGRDPEVEGLEGRPIGELVSELLAEGRTLLREEVRLAKAEVRAEARKAGRAGVAFGAGGVLLHAAALCLVATLVLAGATFLPPWASALIVAALVGAAGWAAIAAGKKKLAEADPARAVRNLKEDGRWAKETMRSIRSSGRGNA